MRAIITDSEKKAAWQKVIMHFSGFVFADVGFVLRSAPMV